MWRVEDLLAGARREAEAEWRPADRGWPARPPALPLPGWAPDALLLQAAAAPPGLPCLEAAETPGCRDEVGEARAPPQRGGQVADSSTGARAGSGRGGAPISGTAGRGRECCSALLHEARPPGRT